MSRRSRVAAGGCEVEGGGDPHTAAQGAGHRTPVGMKAVGALGRGALGRVQLQVVVDVDRADYQDLAVLTDIAGRLTGEVSLASRYVARFQRASQRPGQSPGGGRHHKVQRRGMRRMLPGVDAVVLG